MSTIACPHCKAPADIAAFLLGLCAYAPGTAHFTSRCPACQSYLEFQVRAGRLELGYTYWAGSMHFEGVISHAINGLAVDAHLSPPAIRHGEAIYRVHPEPPGQPAP